MKRSIYLIIPVLLISFPCKAQTHNDYRLSFDFSYSFTSLFNQGWGIGLNYEKKLFDFLSAKGNFGHMTFSTGINDVYCTSVHLSLYANYYPLSNGLDKLYIGIGNGCDFMNYFGKGKLPNSTEDILIHITPQLGWKFNTLKYLMFDISTGYKFIITNKQNYKGITKYINDGFRFGFNFYIPFSGIKNYFHKSKKENYNETDN